MVWLKRIIVFFTRPLYPYPPEETFGTRVFMAPLFWERNVCAIPVVVVGVAPLFVTIACILIVAAGTREAWLGAAGLVASVIAGLLIYFPGKYGAYYPYAVEIEAGKGLRFYTPLGRIYVSIEEVDRVKWSWSGAGWIVRLKKSRRLLTGFNIHVAWGREGRELARAIEDELARAA